MAREYARSIAVDYAFSRFHADGYGKHYRVLTLSGITDFGLDVYLTGCLLADRKSTRLNSSHRT